MPLVQLCGDQEHIDAFLKSHPTIELNNKYYQCTLEFTHEKQPTLIYFGSNLQEYTRLRSRNSIFVNTSSTDLRNDLFDLQDDYIELQNLEDELIECLSTIDWFESDLMAKGSQMHSFLFQDDFQQTLDNLQAIKSQASQISYEKRLELAEQVAVAFGIEMDL